MSIRLYVRDLLNNMDDGNPATISWLNQVIITGIVLSVAMVVIETEVSIASTYPSWFLFGNLFFGVFFLIEYVLRIWSTDQPRLKFVCSRWMVLDLIVLVPFFLTLIPDMLLLRLIRVIKLFSLAKLGRYSTAIWTVSRVLYSRRYELIAAFLMSGVVILCASSGIYLLEGATQPEAMGSIPRAMWWGIATFTTIGYGDVYPVTMAGKTFAGIFALGALGIVALPAGILSAAFLDVFQKKDLDYDRD